MTDLMVEPESVSELASTLLRAANGIQASLDALSFEVRRLREAWTGEASDAFDRAEADWAAQMAELRVVLSGVSDSTESGAATYTDADSAVAAIWSI